TAEFAAPLALDPNNPAIVYSGRHLLWRSADHGLTWAGYNATGLPAPTSCFSAGCIHRIAVAKGNSSELFVVDSLDWNTYVTTTGAAGSWSIVASSAAAAAGANQGEVTGAAVDPSNNLQVFASARGFPPRPC